MKKISCFLAAAAVMAFAAVGVDAQTRWGIQAGITSSSAKIKDVTTESVSNYHAGLFLQIPLVSGFSIQPGVLYQVKGASLDEMGSSSVVESIKSINTDVGYVEIPVQIQWGPDLLLFRPYVLAEPFVGIAVATTSNGKNQLDISKSNSSLKDSGLSRWEYGFALGAGVDIWRLQLSAKYFRNFGSLYSGGDSVGSVSESVTQTVKNAFSEKDAFSGIMFSLGLKF